MKVELIIGIIGGLASLLGFIYGFIQTRKLQREKDLRQINIWRNVSTIKALMRNIERKQYKMAEQGSLELFRSLLAQAISFEKKFNYNILKAWRKTGRIASDWQEREALLHIKSHKIIEDFDKIELKDSETDDLTKFDQLKQPRTKDKKH